MRIQWTHSSNFIYTGLGIDDDDDLCYSIRWIKITTKRKKKNENAFECQPPDIEFNGLSFFSFFFSLSLRRCSFREHVRSQIHIHCMILWTKREVKINTFLFYAPSIDGRAKTNLRIPWSHWFVWIGRSHSFVSTIYLVPYYFHRNLDNELKVELCQHSVLVVLTSRNCAMEDRSIHFMPTIPAYSFHRPFLKMYNEISVEYVYLNKMIDRWWWTICAHNHN